MRRQLTPREWILLGLLGIMLVASGYALLFYMPTKSELDRCVSETESCRAETEAAQIQLGEKRRMERELEELFSRESQPISIADYDNLQPVMFELNTILSGAQNYSLSFGTVDTSASIVRRSIALTFTAGSYEAAKAIIRQLHDSAYRCMLSDLSISMGGGEGGGTSVSGNLVFFEYQSDAPAAAAEATG